MNRPLNLPMRYFLPLLGLSLAVPAFAGDKDQLRCGVNQDRVWVYQNLTSFDVGASLKCGENIEIVSRVRGYVKVRSASGAEGYVPDSSLPDLAPLPDPDDKIVAASGAALANSGETSLAAAARAARAAKPSASPTTVATTQPPVSAPVVPSAAPATPMPAQAPQPAEVASTQAPSATAAPAMPPSTPKLEPAAVASVQSPGAVPAPAMASSSAATATLVSTDAKPASAPAKQVNASSRSTKHPRPVPAEAPAVTASPVAVKTESMPVDETKLDAPTPARTYPVRDVVTPSRSAMVKTASDKIEEVPIGAEYPDTEPQNESADPACHTFFSAYGLSPSQFKWLAANRQKLYPSICPAPSLASVDFVVLLTHDSDTYNAAMPTSVHTDRAGFSDFNPLTTIDTALLSGPDADRARHEYVWIFKMRRGGFDPMKFSPRRRPQFATESKGSAKAIQDAFSYLQGQGTQLEVSEQSNQQPLQ